MHLIHFFEATKYPKIMTPEQIMDYVQTINREPADFEVEAGAGPATHTAYMKKLIGRTSQFALTEVPVSNYDTEMYADQDLVDKYYEMLMSGNTDYPPIVVNEKGRILDGAHRLAALEYAGVDTVRAYKPVQSINENQQLIATAMKWAKDSYGELMFGHKPEDFEWTVHQNFPVNEFGDKKEWIDLFGREREAVKFRARKGNKRAEQELADWQDIVQTGARKPVMALKYPERKGTAGGYEILDGYHRIGATFTSGRPTLPAVIGVIKPKVNEQWVPPDVERYAAGYQDNSNSFRANEVDWEYDAEFPLNMFIDSKNIDLGYTNVKGWADWYHGEVRDFIQDQGHDLWGNLEHEQIEEPVVAVFTDDGWDLWDGWHRVGASIAAGRTTIPAVVGTLKPGGIDESLIEDSNGWITAYHGGADFEGDFKLGHQGRGENNLILGPGIYFADNPDIAKRYTKYAGNPAMYSVEINMSNIYDPVHGEPQNMRGIGDKMAQALGFQSVDDMPSAPSTFTYGKWPVGNIVKYLGRSKALAFFREFGLDGLYEILPDGTREIAVYNPAAIRNKQKITEAQGQLLYHGTNVWNLANIITSDTLREGVHWGRPNEPHGPRFSRSLELGRSFTEYASPDWPIGGVLAVDYNRLAADYKLIDYQDVDVAGEPWSDEQEVAAITTAIHPLSKYLTGIECSMEVIEQAMSKEGLDFAINGFGYMDNEEQAIAALKKLAAHPLLNKGKM